jgi:hypothetical protein
LLFSCFLSTLFFLSFCFPIFFLFIYSYLYSFCRSLTHPVCFYSIIYVFLRSCIHWYFPFFFPSHIVSIHLFLFVLLRSFTHSLINPVCFSLIIYVFCHSCIYSCIHTFICYWNVCILCYSMWLFFFHLLIPSFT